MNAEPCAHVPVLMPRSHGLRRAAITVLMSLGLASPQTQAAAPARPAVDLLVQVRMISDADWEIDPTNSRATASAAPGSISLSSAATEPSAVQAQEIRVRNGEQAALSWSQTLPIQWLQAASYRGSTTGSNSRAGIVNALVWLRAGQSLSVRPSWPGGRHPVRVELQFDTESLGERQNQGVPSTQRQTTSSTLSAPLGQWITFAATGTAAPAQSPTTWSSQSRHGRQLMQLRVTTE